MKAKFNGKLKAGKLHVRLRTLAQALKAVRDETSRSTSFIAQGRRGPRGGGVVLPHGLERLQKMCCATTTTVSPMLVGHGGSCDKSWPSHQVTIMKAATAGGGPGLVASTRGGRRRYDGAGLPHPSLTLTLSPVQHPRCESCRLVRAPMACARQEHSTGNERGRQQNCRPQKQFGESAVAGRNGAHASQL